MGLLFLDGFETGSKWWPHVVDIQFSEDDAMFKALKLMDIMKDRVYDVRESTSCAGHWEVFYWDDAPF